MDMSGKIQATRGGGGIWNKSHHLDRMTLRELIVAYFQHYTIVSYLVLSVVAVVVAALYPTTPLRMAASAIAAAALYPLIWHLLHQHVLHGQWMYRFKWLSATWKRIHYDHHQDPNHLEVLFGALHTTLPTIAVATLPVGWLIGGAGGAATALAAGLLTTCYYEFVHCIQHLAFKPKSKRVARMKQRHMEHHFHHERGNFGITNYWWDHVLGTYYERKDRPDKSPTVFNLGYTEDVAVRYPWVKQLSGGVIATGHPRQRAKG